MDAIFQTPFKGKAADVRIGEAAYPAVGQASDGTVLVEAPVEVGVAQGWTRRIDLEVPRAAEAAKKAPAGERAKDREK